MRYASHVAALIGLLALGLALGDFLSDPGAAGGVLVLAILVVLVVALGHLYRPGGVASRRPAPPRAAEPAEPARARASDPAEPAQPRASRRKAPGAGDGLWSGGWDAGEADEARERRRQDRRRRRGR